MNNNPNDPHQAPKGAMIRLPQVLPRPEIEIGALRSSEQS